jgi:F-type H+-transporting ATPase subunit epsilon
MQLDILSPEKKVYSGEAVAVQFPGTTGSFQVLNNHAAMIASLAKGIIKVKTGKDTQSFQIEGGFVEVLNNQVSVLVEGARAI